MDETVDLSSRATASELFERVRYMSGERSGGTINNAGMCLSRRDTRTIASAVIKSDQNCEGLGVLGNGTARLLYWLLQQSYVTHVAIAAQGGRLVVLLYLPNGQSNPGLALLNLLREHCRKPVLSGEDIVRMAGVQVKNDYVVRPDDKTPEGCLVTDALDALLTAAVNALIPWQKPAATA